MVPTYVKDVLTPLNPEQEKGLRDLGFLSWSFYTGMDITYDPVREGMGDREGEQEGGYGGLRGWKGGRESRREGMKVTGKEGMGLTEKEGKRGTGRRKVWGLTRREGRRKGMGDLEQRTKSSL